MAKTRQPESGFALLLIFCLAAIVGIMMYAAAPRVAFEAQRDQEQLLIDRGGQYKRAIQLYYRTFKRYPGKMEDLENTANQRFLRRRYADPISGKEEWRLVHVGPGGVLIDSVNKAPEKPGRTASVNNFITELPALGAAPAGGGANESLALRRRPSDQAGAAGNGAPLDANAIADAAADGVAPSTPSPFGPDGRPLPAGATPLGAYAGISPQAPQPPGAANAPNGYPNPTGAYANSNAAGGTPPIPVQPGMAPSGNNQAAQMIQRLLTSPRPGGFPGQPPGVNSGGGNPLAPNDNSTAPDQFGNAPTATPAPMGPQPANSGPSAISSVLGAPMGGMNQQPGQMVGGGIAGVASKVEREGIKVYEKKTKYNQWEFIYDFGKESAAAALQGAPGAAPARTGSGFQGLPQPGSPSPIKP